MPPSRDSLLHGDAFDGNLPERVAHSLAVCVARVHESAIACPHVSARCGHVYIEVTNVVIHHTNLRGITLLRIVRARAPVKRLGSADAVRCGGLVGVAWRELGRVDAFGLPAVESCQAGQTVAEVGSDVGRGARQGARDQNPESFG